MNNELEIAGLASAGALSAGDGHPVDPDKPCANCGGEIGDRYCTSCGQLASDFHRPIWDLVLTSLGDTFAFDGRLWRSVPMLLLRPGRMTRNYLDGKRTRYVPPFRLFLIGSVLFFLTIFTLGDQLGWYSAVRINGDDDLPAAVTIDETGETPRVANPEIEGLRQALEAGDLSEAERVEIEAQLVEAETGVLLGNFIQGDKVDRAALRAEMESRIAPDTTPEVREQIWRQVDHAATVYENQDLFMAKVREWAPRFSLLFMPILAIMLTVLYAWHRSRYIYDHIITSLHVQTFFYMLATVLVLIGAILPDSLPWLILIAVLVVPSYIYRQLRVTYGTGRIMAVLRTLILLPVGFIILAILFGLMIAVSFYLV